MPPPPVRGLRGRRPEAESLIRPQSRTSHAHRQENGGGVLVTIQRRTIEDIVADRNEVGANIQFSRHTDAYCKL